MTNLENNQAIDQSVQPEIPVSAAVEPIAETVKKVTPTKAAADTKKKRVRKKENKDKIHKTPDGFSVRFHPVAANVIREAQVRIPDPVAPTFVHPTSGEERENLSHPEYIKELAAVKELRVKAAMNAMLLFGLELIDPIPDDNDWLDKLLYLQLINQAEFDEATSEEGKFLRELFYKNFIVSDLIVLKKLQGLSGITEEMIAQARKTFQRSS